MALTLTANVMGAPAGLVARTKLLTSDIDRGDATRVPPFRTGLPSSSHCRRGRRI